MGLEAGTGYIGGLVATNPVGATDPKSQGDDHIRLIKAALLGSFPAITGAVTADQTELNYLDGATGLTGTGNTVRSASPTFTGTIVAAALTASGTVTGNLFSGSGASLTALVAANITAGGTLPALNGAALTALNASNIASGSLADARLSANVPLLNAANAFTANQTVTGADNGATLTLAATTGKLKLHAYHSSFSGTFLQVRNGGDSAAAPLYVTASLTTLDSPVAFTGALTTPNASASEVGYKGIPVNTQSVSYTCVLADAGGLLRQTGASKTFTIPAQASVNYPVGTTLTFVADGTTAVSIAITTDTLVLAGTAFATTGTRSLALGGVATAVKFASQYWLISGPGLS